jgi:UDP-galactopyranose mutase
LNATGRFDITVFDQRDHVAGNVYTEQDDETGVMVHKYGPHIFHTDNAIVWKWFGQFARMRPYVQRTKALSNGRVYSFPINLHTLNQFFDHQLTPAGAEEYVRTRAFPILGPSNFEEMGLSLLGRELYCAFLRDYTIKQWGLHPTLLPASILNRLPLRFDYNDNAYNHRFQGIPEGGYTNAVARMLDGDNITLKLNTEFVSRDSLLFDHTFYSGCIDEWFHHRLGRLPYRTLDFEVIRAEGDFQGCSVINSCDLSTPWTRSTEHKHFTPWERHAKTIVYREYSRTCLKGDIPYYPIRFAEDKEQLAQYQKLAAGEDDVTFIGRLGTYQYLDMDKTICESLKVAQRFIATNSN